MASLASPYSIVGGSAKLYASGAGAFGEQSIRDFKKEEKVRPWEGLRYVFAERVDPQRTRSQQRTKDFVYLRIYVLDVVKVGYFGDRQDENKPDYDRPILLLINPVSKEMVDYFFGTLTFHKNNAWPEPFNIYIPKVEGYEGKVNAAVEQINKEVKEMYLSLNALGDNVTLFTTDYDYKAGVLAVQNYKELKSLINGAFQKVGEKAGATPQIDETKRY